MYTEQDLTNIRSQIKKRWLAIIVPCAVLLALIIVFLIQRNEILTDVLTILLGVTLIAGYDLFIKPLSCYKTHLNNVLHGMTHELVAEYSSFSEDISLVDGVAYKTLTVVCYDEKNKPYDRMFYYDTEKPLPDFIPGQPLKIIYHDHELASVTPA